jgi:hypothetical protein
MGVLLRYPYEVRDAAEYFDEIQDVKITKDMLDLARHIVESKAGHLIRKNSRIVMRRRCRNCWKKGEGPADCRREARRPQQRFQPDGCTEGEHQGWQRSRPGRKAVQENARQTSREAQGRLMVKKGPWSDEEDRRLLELRDAGRTTVSIASSSGRLSVVSRATYSLL